MRPKWVGRRPWVKRSRRSTTTHSGLRTPGETPGTGKGYFKKSGHAPGRNRTFRYTLIQQLQVEYPLTLVCEVVGIRRSSYYAWQKRPVRTPPSPLQLQAQAVHRRSRGAAGSRTIAQALGVSRWRARKLMQASHLVSRQPGKPKFRPAKAEGEVVPNQLNRAFQPLAPNQIWCGDITYIAIGGRWAYLAVVLDLYARRVVGWSLAPTPDTALVSQALRRAIATRQPKAGLLFHSDQGVQYRSRAFRQHLVARQIGQSMSRKGNCWDNAPMERLFRSLKTEWIPAKGYDTLPGGEPRYWRLSDGLLQPGTAPQL